MQGDYKTAAPLLEATLAMVRGLAGPFTEGAALATLGWLAFGQGEYRTGQLERTIRDLRARTTYPCAVAARDNVSRMLGPRSVTVRVRTR